MNPLIRLTPLHKRILHNDEYDSLNRRAREVLSRELGEQVPKASRKSPTLEADYKPYKSREGTTSTLEIYIEKYHVEGAISDLETIAHATFDNLGDILDFGCDTMEIYIRHHFTKANPLHNFGVILDNEVKVMTLNKVQLINLINKYKDTNRLLPKKLCVATINNQGVFYNMLGPVSEKEMI